MRILPAKRGPSPGLARIDPGMPVQLAQNSARGLSKLMSGVSSFVDEYADAQDATTVAQQSAEYKKRTSILQNRLEASPTIDFNSPLITDEMREGFAGPQIDDYGVDTSDAPSYLESHEVMQEIYDRETQRYEDFALSKIKTQKGRDDFYKFISTQRATSAGKIVAKSLEWRRSSMSVTADMAAQTAINLPDPVEANASLLRVADTSFKKGIWTYEKFFKTVTEGQQAIEYRAYDKEVRSAGTQEGLDDIRRTLQDPGAPTLMTPTQHHKLLDDIDSREKGLDKDLHASIKDRKEESSGGARVDALFLMTKRNGPLTPTELRQALSRATEVGDATAIMALQRVMIKAEEDGNTTVKSDPLAMLQAQSIIQQLLFYSEEPMNLRRKDARNLIFELAGMDPDTGKIRPDGGEITITGPDLGRLSAQIDEMQNRMFKTADITQVVDTIYGLLTKGGKLTKDRRGRDTNRFAYTLAVEAETDLLNAAATRGRDFNAKKWWRDNKSIYITPTMEDNIRELGQQFGKGVIVFGGARPQDQEWADVDLAATRKAAERKFPSTPRRVEQIMNYATHIQTLSAEDAAAEKAAAAERRKARQ